MAIERLSVHVYLYMLILTILIIIKHYYIIYNMYYKSQ